MLNAALSSRSHRAALTLCCTASAPSRIARMALIRAGLVQATDGNFYGTAGGGGAHAWAQCSRSLPAER